MDRDTNTLGAGQLRTPGVLRTLKGNMIDLCNFTKEDVDIDDIAWGLGRTLRYGGHIREDYTVAHHSVVMSYLVPEAHAKEALLHDAAEAYMGDIIWPVKALFPEVSEFEDSLLYTIMQAFDVPSITLTINDGTTLYAKSPEVSSADNELLAHECFEMGRPGIFYPEVEAAWLKAAMAHEQWWGAPTYLFLERFDQLFGTEHLDLERLTEAWFKHQKVSIDDIFHNLNLNETFTTDIVETLTDGLSGPEEEGRFNE